MGMLEINSIATSLLSEALRNGDYWGLSLEKIKSKLPIHLKEVLFPDHRHKDWDQVDPRYDQEARAIAAWHIGSQGGTYTGQGMPPNTVGQALLEAASLPDVQMPPDQMIWEGQYRHHTYTFMVPVLPNA